MHSIVSHADADSALKQKYKKWCVLQCLLKCETRASSSSLYWLCCYSRKTRQSSAFLDIVDIVGKKHARPIDAA